MAILTALKLGKPSGTDQKGDFHKPPSVALHVHTCICRFCVSRMAILIVSKIIVPHKKKIIEDRQ